MNTHGGSGSTSTSPLPRHQAVPAGDGLGHDPAKDTPGRDLQAIRKRILQSGIPLASRGEILGELAEARRERR